MVQPSYPHTVELPHSRPYSKEEFNEDGTPKVIEASEVATLAPSEFASLESHANDSNQGQAERPDTKPVNKGSSVRIENEPGPGGPQ